jgi:hypothetical protein
MFAALFRVDKVEVLAHPVSDTLQVGGRQVMDLGSTVFNRSIDPVLIRTFRKPFIVKSQTATWKYTASSSVCLALLFAPKAHGIFAFATRFLVIFCAWTAIQLVIGWAVSRWSFNQRLRNSDRRYCWLQHGPEGHAIAVLLKVEDQWNFQLVHSTGPRAHEILSELMHDICRYADRNRLVLLISAPDTWLVDELDFELQPRTRFRRRPVLRREPCRSRGEIERSVSPPPADA